MRNILITLFLIASFDTLSQGALVVKRFEKTPTDQWFTFSGKRSEGTLIYHGTPTVVESELIRVMDYYRIDHDNLKLSDGIEEFVYTVNKIYTLRIYISELDKFEWTRTIYLLITK